VVGLAANVGLTALKFLVGTLAGSAALIADGFNSAGDIVASAVGWAGYTAARVPPDDNHHYGHGKFESASGLIIGGILLATGVFVAIDGVRVLLSGPRPPPETLAVWAAVATAVIKEVLCRYTWKVGSELNSPSLLASARDHRADVVIAVAVVAAVLGAQWGWTWLDPTIAVVIGGYISILAIDPIASNLKVLMDETDPALSEEIRIAARSVEDVREAGGIRVHPVGADFFVELEIYVDGDLPLGVAHDIAHAVGDAIEERVAHISDVRVHVNPTGMV